MGSLALLGLVMIASAIVLMVSGLKSTAIGVIALALLVIGIMMVIVVCLHNDGQR